MNRKAATLIELIVVLSIIGVLLALLFPALQSAREKARETICKNNVYQLNMAIGNFWHVYKRLPGPPTPGKLGGWTIEILPFIEQKNLANRIPIGTRIEDAESFVLEPPRLFRCPTRSGLDNIPDGTMRPAHYVLVPFGRRDSYSLFESPVKLVEPWGSGPELSIQTVRSSQGPHHGGLFHSNGFQQGIE